MLTVLKIWNLFLVSGSGPTGFKGWQRGIDSALASIGFLPKFLGKKAA
jgi:hypothetical protein